MAFEKGTQPRECVHMDTIRSQIIRDLLLTRESNLLLWVPTRAVVYSGPWHLAPCVLSSFALFISQQDLSTKIGYQQLSCHSLHFIPTRFGGTVFFSFFFFFHFIADKVNDSKKKKCHSALWGSRDEFLVCQGMPCHTLKCLIRIFLICGLLKAAFNICCFSCIVYCPFTPGSHSLMYPVTYPGYSMHNLWRKKVTHYLTWILLFYAPVYVTDSIMNYRYNLGYVKNFFFPRGGTGWTINKCFPSDNIFIAINWLL